MNKPLSRDSFLPPLWVLTVLSIWGLFWLASSLREIVVLLVVGYCLAYIIDPILEYLEKKKISRAVGVFVIMALFLIFVLLVFITALPIFFREYDELSKNFPHYLKISKEKFSPLIEKIQHLFPREQSELSPTANVELLPQIPSGALQTVFSGVLSALLSGYSITLTLLNLTLLPFIVFYLSIDFQSLHSNILRLFPKKIRKQVSSVALEIDHYVSAFVRGQLMVCTTLFVLYALGLYLVGIDLWFLMAVLAGFGNIIPYFGFLSGILLSSIMALVTFGDFAHMIQVWVVFAVVQFLEGFVITPKIIGDKVGLSPLIIILAIFAGGQIFGLLGIFLAIPGAAVIRVFFRHLHDWVLKKVEA